MRLSTPLLLAAIILPCLRTADLRQPDDNIRTEHVNRDLDKLNLNKEILEKTLENASLEIDGFLLDGNETSAHRTIEIVRGYIINREEFIKQIHDLKPRVPSQANSSLFDEVRWIKELNRTKSELSKLERVTKLYESLLKLNEKNEKVNNLTLQFKVEGKDRQLESAVNIGGELVKETESFIHEVTDVRNFTLTHNLTGVITNPWIEQLLDVQSWKYFLRNKTEELLVLERMKISTVFNRYIRPSVYSIIFVVGLAENVVLIIIFAR